jgi:hypothetical protein
MLREGFPQGVNQRFPGDLRTLLLGSVIAHAGLSSRQPLGIFTLNPNPQHLTLCADFAAGAQCASHPRLSALDFVYLGAQPHGVIDWRRPDIRDLEMSRHIKDFRAAPDRSPFGPIRLGYRQIETMTVNQSRDDAAVDDTFGAAAVVRLRVPSAHGFIAVPGTLDLQAHLVVGTTAKTVTDRSEILKRLLVGTLRLNFH